MRSDSLTVDTLPDIESQYNQTPYTSYPFPQSHPRQLYLIASLFGQPAERYETARVLELGCGGGWNLIPMAFHFPQARFTGIDLSQRQVASANEAVEALKLTNIRIVKCSIDQWQSEERYDYIICHGVFSWVGPQTQNNIFKICRDQLTENGIAYISYNVYPGWNMVKTMRQLLQWRTQGLPDHDALMSETRSFLPQLEKYLSRQNTPYAQFMRHQIHQVSRSEDPYLLHEYFEGYNDPVYFHQFVSQARPFGLQYLGEVYLGHSLFLKQEQNLWEGLRDATDRLECEQMKDFIENTRFRSSLLYRGEIPSTDDFMRVGTLRDKYIRCAARLEPANLTPEEVADCPATALVLDQYRMEQVEPESMMIAVLLNDYRDRSISVADFVKALLAATDLATPADAERCLMDQFHLEAALRYGMVELSPEPGPDVSQVSDRPQANAMIQYQLASELGYVTHWRHQSIRPDKMGRFLLRHMDGRRTVEELQALVMEALVSKELKLSGIDPAKLEKSEQIQTATRDIISNRITRLVRGQLVDSQPARP